MTDGEDGPPFGQYCQWQGIMCPVCCGPARSLAGPPVAGSGSDGVHVACSEILKRYEERSCFCNQPRRDVGRDELE